MTKKLLLLLVLLLTATMSIWAQTTHVVTQTTVDNIFNGDGYTLGDAVKAGDVLDFQGEIDLQHSLIVNKQVTIKSTTTDAVVKLNTPTNVKPDDYSATVMYPQSFVINKAGSGTTVQDIRIENTETWLYNTSNVTFTGVTMWVEEARIGSGVGQVSIRYSDHVTFDGCTVYSKNNGGSSGCLLTGSHDCTFKDTRFEAVGNAGNPLYLGSPYNTNDMPAGYTMNADNISVLNCTLTKDVASATCMFAIGGLRHHIEGCTIVKMRTLSAIGATMPNSASEGHTILNNTITDGNLDVIKYCTAEGNTVTGTGNVTVQQGATATGNTITGNVTVSGIGATVKDNTITGNVSLSNNDITFTGNKVQGKLTHSQKTATITGNTIISTEEYAVYLNSTAADANNTVTNNDLKAATKTGDDAVSSKSESNTIRDNDDANKYTAKLKDGVQDADKWTIAPAEATTDGVYKGTTITATYSGTKKVLGMKVAKKAANVHSITIAVDPSTNELKATAPAMTIEFKTGETWADVAARYDWLDTYETYTVFYKNGKLMGNVHNANGGVKPNQTIDPNGSYHWEK